MFLLDFSQSMMWEVWGKRCHVHDLPPYVDIFVEDLRALLSQKHLGNTETHHLWFHNCLPQYSPLENITETRGKHFQNSLPNFQKKTRIFFSFILLQSQTRSQLKIHCDRWRSEILLCSSSLQSRCAGPLDIHTLQKSEDMKQSKSTVLFTQTRVLKIKHSLAMHMWNPGNRFVLNWLSVLASLPKKKYRQLTEKGRAELN